jgi:hypothetical protein
MASPARRPVAQQPEVVYVGERAGQIRLDEAQRAAQGFEAALHENPGRVLDIVPGRLDEARRLAQLREHPPRAFLSRRKIEQRLPCQAQAEQLAVHLGVALPRPDLLEFVNPPLDVCGDPGPLHALDAGQRVGADGRQPPRQTGQGLDLVLDDAALKFSAGRLRWTPSKVDAVGSYVQERGSRRQSDGAARKQPWAQPESPDSIERIGLKTCAAAACLRREHPF